ncbi:protein translocase subunit SecF [Acetobacterium sp.]|jgi:preprotein translocase subunit SecF|uniref:protein translocase subunit SecF n=1 Tax=Acetobacterium sp. TaxID=1872094 RepID=UPI000CBD6E95|nr:protein translocase subunit SecF [Acetobacterium sp.]MDO9493599.1 protein translocase subunit SecF [Acetobacterium sp.]PKM75082.1 MAG: protein translocase subunit SecF [Firmicutes bacterium HGW-Firmicutes-17]
MKKNIQIAEKSKIWFAFSLILIAISIGSLFINGLNFGIDFIGGTIVTIELNTPFETSDAKALIEEYDTSADVTYAGEAKTQVIISTKKDLSTAERQALFSKFQEKYNLEDTDLLSIDTVSPSIGAEMANSSMIAAVVAVLLMLVYITFRFEFMFGLAAVIALIHDLIIVLGVYSIFQIQVNSPLIAALLTILGYSINDTIVVFDRIRENRPKFGKYDFANLVDTSVTQTLRRSINTSFTTLLAIGALYTFGVPAVQDFALPLMVGIVSGTYSSIFVASALWCKIKEFQASKRAAVKS